MQLFTGIVKQILKAGVSYANCSVDQWRTNKVTWEPHHIMLLMQQ